MWGDVTTELFAGYRYLHLDYEKRGIEIDLEVKGPLVGSASSSSVPSL
jgi:hypothetical protein